MTLYRSNGTRNAINIKLCVGHQISRAELMVRQVNKYYETVRYENIVRNNDENVNIVYERNEGKEVELEIPGVTNNENTVKEKQICDGV